MQAIKTLKTRQTTFLIFFISFVGIHSTTLAQSIADNSSSLEIGIENNLQTENPKLHQAQILLTEVNFKNTEEDFLKFKVTTTEPSLNLKGLEFYDDKIFKTIDQDFFVHSGDQITLFFNLSQPDNSSSRELFTDHTGLTATTEQIILKQGDYYFDFLCWQKNPISKTEQVDFQKIFQNNFWDNNNIASCLDSSKLANNQSLFRNGETHHSTAWNLITADSTDKTNNATAPPNDNITDQPSLEEDQDIQSNEYIEDNSEDISAISEQPRALTPAIYAPNIKKPSSKTTSKTSSKATTLAVQLASLGPDQIPTDQSIIITEIMPAPAKSPDSKETPEEWIELYNQSESDIDLAGWIIDDSDGGSKPHILESQILNVDNYLILKSSQTKLNLNNSSDQVRLFDPQKNLIDAVEYQEAEKNSSYARLTIDDQTEWSWQKSPTPGSANPIFISIIGKIISAPVFDQIYHFQIQTTLNTESESPTTYTIAFDESTVKAPLAKNLFTPGTVGKFIGQLIDTEGPQAGSISDKTPTLQLNQYQLDQIIPTENNNSLPAIIIGTILAIGGSIYFIVKNKSKWINGSSGKSALPS